MDTCIVVALIMCFFRPSDCTIRHCKLNQEKRLKYDLMSSLLCNEFVVVVVVVVVYSLMFIWCADFSQHIIINIVGYRCCVCMMIIFRTIKSQ